MLPDFVGKKFLLWIIQRVCVRARALFLAYRLERASEPKAHELE